MTKDSLGDRMKGYENASRYTLPRRMPLFVRVDGKAFHTFCEDLARPFDLEFMAAMDQCAIDLMIEAHGAVLAYVQSDEITILIHNYKRLDTDPWFGNDLLKIATSCAATASSTMTAESPRLFGHVRKAKFDGRAWVMPESEVANEFLWRQQDAARNSVSMVACSMFSDQELEGVTTPERQEMIFRKSGRNWNDFPIYQRRGRCIVRETYEQDGVTRSRWVVDRAIPIFSKDRAYIERLLEVEPEDAPTEPRLGVEP
jgi:tRNA(His) 5'-end guanylyltransferase